MSKRKNARAQRGLCFALIVLAALAIMFFAVTPKSYNVTAGDVSDETIIASREVLDEIATQENRQKARDSVIDQYKVYGAVTVEVQEQIDTFYESVENVRLRAAEMLEKLQSDSNAAYVRENPGEPASNAPQVTYETAIRNGDMDDLYALLPQQMTVEDGDLLAIITVREEDLEYAHQLAKQLVDDEMTKAEGLREDQVEVAQSEILRRLNSMVTSEKAVQVAYMPVRQYLKPNMVLDEEATETARQKAEDDVTPIVYKKGQAIVRQGEVLTENHVEMLRSLGMLAGGVNLRIYLGAMLSVLASAGVSALFVKLFVSGTELGTRHILLCGLIMLLSLGMTAFLLPIDTRALPILFVPLSIAVTINVPVGALLGIVNCALSSFMMVGAGVETATAFSFTMAGLVACPIAAVCAGHFSSRSGIMLAGVLGSLSAAAMFVTTGLQVPQTAMQMLESVLYALGVGIISGVLCVGMTPIWESMFQILTPMKLMELCNSNNHLLKRLAMEAPGTYHHSTMVANLAESAADAVGANGLLARAGAYYHDVGKLKAPMYYKENQMGENPHDYLAPEESARIIAMHPIDGEEMIREARLPGTIAEIALQHHGTFLMGYFYQAACVQQNGEVDEERFRHMGGKPTTREAAIIMLADAVEAAVRAESDDFRDTIDTMIRTRLHDGQLDLAPLTMADLTRIADAFNNVLIGAYHNRIKYPKLNKQAPAPALDEAAEAEEADA